MGVYFADGGTILYRGDDFFPEEVNNMDCKQLDCGCIVSCKQKGGLVTDCDKILGCDYHTWRVQHPGCQNCCKCLWCGTCDCPERFGI